MAVFVDLALDLEQADELTTFMHKLQGEGENVDRIASQKALLESRNISELVLSLVEDFNLIFEKCEKSQIEGIFNLLCSHLRKLDDAQKGTFLSAILAHIVSNENDPNAALRLKLMNNLFNIFDEKSPRRFEILVKIIKYAGASQNAHILVPHLGKTDGWISAWNLNGAQQRELYSAIYSMLSREGSEETELQLEFLIKLLTTFNGDSNEAKGSVKNEAATLIVKIAQSDSIYEFDDYLSLEAVEQLKEDSKFACMHELLQIMAKGTVKDLVEFDGKNGSFVNNTFGLTQEAIMRRMRILTLVALGSKKSVLPFSQVTQELRITEDEVVMWVFEATSIGAFEAKLDELENAVIVLRSRHRVFGKEEWAKLQVDLHVCQQNLSHMMSVIDKNTQSSHIMSK